MTKILSLATLFALLATVTANGQQAPTVTIPVAQPPVAATSDQSEKRAASIKAATESLKDDAPVVRGGAASFLGRFKSEARASIPALTAALDAEKHPTCRAELLEAVGEIGGNAAIAYLTTMSTHAKPETRIEACAALGLTEDKEALAALRARFGRDELAKVKSAAIQATAKLKVADNELAKDLSTLTVDADSGVRGQALLALYAIGVDKTSFALLLQFKLKDTAPWVRATCLDVIGDLGATTLRTDVEAALKDADEKVKSHAATALKKLDEVKK